MEPEITVNGGKVSVEMDDVSHLASLVDKISRTILSPGELISNITVNGIPMEPGSIKAAMPASELVSLEIFTIKNPIEMAAGLLRRMGEYLTSMSPNISKVSDVFRVGSSEEGNSMLVSILEGLSAFTELVETAKSVSRSDLGSITVNNHTLAELEERLLTTLKDLKKAQESNDWVNVADILEYEIVPIIDDWRTILPAVESGLLKGNN